MNRFLRGIAVVLAGSLMLAGCHDDHDNNNTPVPTPVANAQLRIVHASADAGNVDVTIDGASAATNVPYGAATAFAPIAAGVRNVKVDPAGSSTVVINANLTAAPNQFYTVFAIDRLASIGALVVPEDGNAVPSGSARLRVVHASPVAGNVDVYVTAPGVALAATQPTLANVVFKTYSGTLDVPAGAYEFRVTAAGSKTPVYDSGSVTLAAGSNLVAVAIDRATGASPIELLTLTRDPSTPKIDLVDSRAAVRAVHASPDAPNVDILVDGAVVLANVPYPTFSDYLPLAAGAREVKVNVAGTSTTAIDVTPTFAAGKSYSVLAVGLLAQISGLVLEDKLGFPTPDKAFVRVVHASPDAGNVDVLVNGAKVLGNVAFKTASDYLPLPAGSTTLAVNAAGTATTAAQATVTLVGGKVYTVAAIGSKATAATNPIQLKAVIDR